MLFTQIIVMQYEKKTGSKIDVFTSVFLVICQSRVFCFRFFVSSFLHAIDIFFAALTAQMQFVQGHLNWEPPIKKNTRPFATVKLPQTKRIRSFYRTKSLL